MGDELKTYNEGKTIIILLVIAAFLLIFQAIITLFLNNSPDLLEIFFAIFGLIIAVIIFGYILYMIMNPLIVTTRDKIIFNPGPFTKLVEIDVSKIEKINYTIFSNVVIWYCDEKNNIKKLKIGVQRLTEKHQEEFYNYISNVQKKIIYEAI